MKIYEVDPADFSFDYPDYHPTKRKAIESARGYANAEIVVFEVEVGELTKDLACRLASQRDFVIERREVWRTPKKSKGGR